MNQIQKTFESINYVEVNNGANLPAVIMIHGYGANMNDLAPLASYSPIGKLFNWYFPDGLQDVPIGPHMMGKAWFDVDTTRFETGEFGDLYMYHTPAGLPEAVEQLSGFVSHVEEQNNGLILGGFSQGSMMTMEMVLQQRCSPKLVVLLSSTLINGEKLMERLAHVTCPIFQSHGTHDPILPLQYATPLTALLEKQTTVHYHEFMGGHEIPGPVLNELLKLMQKIQG